MYNTRLQSWALRQQKREFNPAEKKDRAEYAYFLRHGRWKSVFCPFSLDWPYLTIPDMVKDRIVHHALHVEKVWER